MRPAKLVDYGFYSKNILNTINGGSEMSKKFVKFKSVWLFSLIIGILVPMVSFAVDPEEFKTVMIEQLEFRPARYLGISDHGRDADEIDANLSNLVSNSVSRFCDRGVAFQK